MTHTYKLIGARNSMKAGKIKKKKKKKKKGKEKKRNNQIVSF